MVIVGTHHCQACMLVLENFGCTFSAIFLWLAKLIDIAWAIYTVWTKVLATPLNHWIQVFHSVPLPHVYKIKHLACHAVMFWLWGKQVFLEETHAGTWRMCKRHIEPRTKPRTYSANQCITMLTNMIKPSVKIDDRKSYSSSTGLFWLHRMANVQRWCHSEEHQSWEIHYIFNDIINLPLCWWHNYKDSPIPN